MNDRLRTLKCPSYFANQYKEGQNHKQCVVEDNCNIIYRGITSLSGLAVNILVPDTTELLQLIAVCQKAEALHHIGKLTTLNSENMQDCTLYEFNYYKASGEGRRGKL